MIGLYSMNHSNQNPSSSLTLKEMFLPQLGAFPLHMLSADISLHWAFFLALDNITGPRVLYISAIGTGNRCCWGVLLTYELFQSASVITRMSALDTHICFLSFLQCLLSATQKLHIS